MSTDQTNPRHSKPTGLKRSRETSGTENRKLIFILKMKWQAAVMALATLIVFAACGSENPTEPPRTDTQETSAQEAERPTATQEMAPPAAEGPTETT